jgi:hypothetical protein
MNFLTTLIPVPNLFLSKNRKRNLDFICDRLKDYFGSENRTIIFSSGNINYFHDFAEILGPAQEIKVSSNFLMFLDPNIFFNFKSLKKSLSFNDSIVLPFSEYFHLDEPLTNEFIAKKQVSINSSTKVASVPFGSGCVILRSGFVSENISNYLSFSENSDDWWLKEDKINKIRVRKSLNLSALRLYHELSIPSLDIKFKKKIVHAFNYACVEESSRLNKDQLRSIESYVVNSKNKGVSLINFHSGDCLRQNGILSVKLARTAKSIGHSKDFPFLNDIFNMAMPYVEGDGWIFYCNSDCSVTNSLYDDILGFEGDYIEFQRQELDDSGLPLGSVRKGIDGIAIRKSLLQKHKMPELLIGAPYWDDAVSTFYSSVCNRKLRIGNQLVHNYHEPTYDLANLDVAGTLNFKSFSDVLSSANSSLKNTIRTQMLIKVPTLGRPEMLFKCLDSFTHNASGNNTLFFCVTCNNDDHTMNEEVVAKLKSRYSNVEVFFGDHKSKIDAYNADLENFDFDVLILASDDMRAVESNYDQVILDLMNNSFPDFDGVLWFETCDGNQITDTLSIMGKRYYDRFGYAYKSDYLGYYCDDEFTQVAFKLGKLKRIDHPIICHHQPDHLKMSDDSTYLKSIAHGMRDKALYKVRKKVQFDVPTFIGPREQFSEIFFQEQRNKHDKCYWKMPNPKFDDPISSMEVYVLENMDRKVAEMDTEQFLRFAHNYFRDFRWTIPQIIHQIWFGDVPPRIKEMMETFSEDYVKKNPGSRYIFWNEKRLKSLGMINKDIFEIEKGYDCKSDIARLEILNRFGGFYVDSDCVWLGNKSLNSVPSKSGIMIAYEKAGSSIGKGYLEKDTTRCANGVFGATIANPIIAFMIGKLRGSYDSKRKHGVVSSTGPDFVQSVLDSLPGLTETASHNYFYPLWWCVNPDKNPEHSQFLNQRDLSIEKLASLHPESVLFHRGFTSSGGGL